VTASDFSLDRTSDVPLGTQLAWKLSTAIATGLLQPGERLPGVRELAESAGVNVNTVRSVYARLEEQGLIASEHGRGTFVAPDAKARDDLTRAVAAAVEAAGEAGVDPREVATALFSGGAPGRAREDERERRRRLRSEIANLERELVHLGRLGDAPAIPAPARGRILSADELEEVRTALVARLAELRREREDALHRRTEEPTGAPAPRVWRHAGVWTGSSSPGRTRTASYGA
jgi:DNA-binding transcriptional regulator YhcF (GntR family)